MISRRGLLGAGAAAVASAAVGGCTPRAPGPDVTTPPRTDELATFPPGFRFGVATSAYQIEGATEAGGRGRSIWDTFCAEPGRIDDGSSGARACDHYRRWEADLDLMQSLNVET